MNIQWDAEKYTSNFSFVHKYGNSVTELIEAPEGSRVLDLGCGNGALTGVLKDQGFQVIGLDDSKNLLSVAKKYFPDLEFIHADATDFSLKEARSIFAAYHKKLVAMGVDGFKLDECDGSDYTGSWSFPRSWPWISTGRRERRGSPFSSVFRQAARYWAAAASPSKAVVSGSMAKPP